MKEQGAFKRLVVALTGASGAPLALQLLKTVRETTDLEVHLILSRGAEMTLEYELPDRREELLSLAHVRYDNHDVGAAVASGSFRTCGMVIIPCSMKTVAGIHSGYSDNLILRAADVTLKEGRPLLLVPREMPLSTIHLRNLYELSVMGVSVIPPVMTFYNDPRTIEDMVSHLVGKILDHLGIPAEYRRWKE